MDTLLESVETFVFVFFWKIECKTPAVNFVFLLKIINKDLISTVFKCFLGSYYFGVINW